MNVFLRPGVPQDAAALVDVHACSWRATYTDFVPAEALGAPLDANMRARWDPWPSDRLIHVAEQDGRLVGFGAVVPGQPPVLDNLHVDPEARSGGIGTALFLTISAALLAQQVDGLKLFVIEGNTRARAFYRRLGGLEGPPESDTLLGHPVHMVPVLFAHHDLQEIASGQ